MPLTTATTAHAKVSARGTRMAVKVSGNGLQTRPRATITLAFGDQNAQREQT